MPAVPGLLLQGAGHQQPGKEVLAVADQRAEGLKMQPTQGQISALFITDSLTKSFIPAFHLLNPAGRPILH